ncbi:MAG: chemotaxis protein CheX [Nocardioidaceae bacterium]|nr:chemotaxis protein CheX [Nocardioidaceae bacterium]MCL2613288.1 chemotaxis protein CheX [Nocardioidaceae bacterium]
MSTVSQERYDAPTLDDVAFVVDEVWRSLLGDEEGLDRLDHPGHALDHRVGTWTGAVSVTGEWRATVTVELGADAAGPLAARMLALPDDEPPTDADIADAVGELVNMVGGNVKSLMPGPSALSLPLVAAGRAAHPSELVEVTRLDAAWHDRAVRFTVAIPRH